MKKNTIILMITAILFLSSCFGNIDLAEINTTEQTESLTVTFGFIGLQPASNNINDPSSRIHQKILDDFGINIETVTLSEKNWKAELQEMIASHTLPDVFFHDIMDDTIQYRQLIDLGIVRDIPKSMWTKQDNLAKVMSWYESTYSADDKMYFVPRTYQTYSQTHGSSYAILYRRDWAYVVGSIPSEQPHFYEVMDMMKEFVAKDPDENDVKDTWGITGGDDFDFILHAFLQPFGVRDWMYEDGKWIPGLLSNKAKEAAAWVSQLYKEGVIDPYFTTQSKDDAINKFITGKAGSCLVSMYPKQISDIERRWGIYNTNAIEQSVDIIPLYFASDGYKYNEVETFSTGTMFSKNISDDNMEKVLSLMNWMYTEEGRMYFEYGVLDEDYSIILGDIVATSQDDKQGLFFGDKNTEYAALENLVSWNLDYSDFYMDMMTEFESYSSDVLKNDVWAYSYQNELFTSGMITPEVCVLNIETVARDMLFETIMISSDFESGWNEYVDYCYNTFNVDEASQEVEKRAFELGITTIN